MTLRLSKPNIGLEIAFWLTLKIFTNTVITQTKKGYWNNFKELNFPARKPKMHNDWVLKKHLKDEILT